MGISGIEINQGDFISGEISRKDVAEVTVHALLSSNCDNVTFELYEKNKRAPLQAKFPKTTGFERGAGAWQRTSAKGSGEDLLFEGLLADTSLQSKLEALAVKV